MNVYLYDRGQQQGPYPLDQIKAWLVSGQIQASMMSRYDPIPYWVPLYCVPQIRDDASLKPLIDSATSGDMNVEEKIVQETAAELDALRERLFNSNTEQQDLVQKAMQRKLNIYWKQVYSFKAQFPDTIEARVYEASFYSAQALTKLGKVGFLRKESARTDSLAWGLVTGLIADQQEKNSAVEALSLLDRAIGIFDSANARLMKASIFYHILTQPANAIRELNHIIATFRDDELYVSARQLKDEIETA